MGAELFHADGQTDMTKVIVAFRNFANAPKNCKNVTLNVLTFQCAKSDLNFYRKSVNK